MGGTHTDAAPVALWTEAERAWAEDCFSAGDEIAEIASASCRTFLDVAMALRVFGFVPLARRWSPVRSGGGGNLAPSRWVGGMLKEVAIYRRLRGETARDLAAEAQVSLATMHVAVRPATAKLPWQPRRQARIRSEAA